MLPRRFEALRDLIPHKDKLDKAAFLRKTIDYIRQLQARPPAHISLCACTAFEAEALCLAQDLALKKSCSNMHLAAELGYAAGDRPSICIH